MQSFGDTVGEKFAYEEIDGAILLSQTVRTEEAMEKLGLHTIGKKGKFLAKVDELSGMRVTRVSVENFQFAISLNLRRLLVCSCLMTYRRLYIGRLLVKR